MHQIHGFDGKEEMLRDIQQSGALLTQVQSMLPIVAAVAQSMPGTPMGQQAAAVMQQATGQGQPMPAPQAQGADIPRVNILGEPQRADDILDRKRNEAASRSDPNGGV